MRINSLVLLKLREPVAWALIDGQPVNVVILLAICEVDGAMEHMKVLSKLARQLMHDEFRAQLERESSETRISAFLQETLTA